MTDNVLITEYTAIEGKLLPTYPLVDVFFTDLKNRKITALVDTGYDGTLLISQESSKKLKLGKKHAIQDEPYDVQVANKETVEVYRYRTNIRLGNIEGPLSFGVVSEKRKLIWDAVLGRSAFYRYELLFNEKSEPKKLIISK